MSTLMLIDATHPEETRVVISDNDIVQEYDFVTSTKTQVKGNIYLAKITRVEPSLQAAFVEYGGGRQGFLPFAEIHPDYYQIPTADKLALFEQEAREREREEREYEEAQQRRAARGDTRQEPRREEDFSEEREEGFNDGYASDGYSSDGDGEEDYPFEGSRPESTGSTDEAAVSVVPDHFSDNGFGDSQEGDNGAPRSVEEGEHFGDEAPSEGSNSESGERNGRGGRDRDRGGRRGGRRRGRDRGGRGGRDRGGRDEAPKEGGEDDVETFAAEEEEITQRPRRSGFLKRYKINEVVKKGQVILIQVIKEERGNKGAALTSYISLAGRYCVLMPNTTGSSGGISRKVTSQDDRHRLKDIVSSLSLPNGMSVIVRTAGADRSRAEIKRDFDYLMRLWNDIRELTLASVAPALVYAESDVIKRAIRDLYKTEIEHIIIEGEESYKNAKNFMKMLMPSHAARIKQYKGDIPLFYAYDVEEQLLSMHDPVVRLHSGGYLVINQTEALVAVDVNSGKSTRERNVEETALKTNMEAAVEIARQLRLRDLAGLLVIDFIDMYEFRHRRMVERTLKEALRNDRAKIQIGRISAFGLLEMSRQRLRPSIAETSSHPCDHCHGTGIVRSVASVSVQLLRMVEKEAYEAVGGTIEVAARPDIAFYILNNKRDALKELELKYQLQLTISGDTTLRAHSFLITRRDAGANDSYVMNENGEYIGRKPPGYKKQHVMPKPLLPEPEDYSDEEQDGEPRPERISTQGGEDDGRGGRRRRRRGRGRDRERSDDRRDRGPAEAGNTVGWDADAGFREEDTSEGFDRPVSRERFSENAPAAAPREGREGYEGERRESPDRDRGERGERGRGRRRGGRLLRRRRDREDDRGERTDQPSESFVQDELAYAPPHPPIAIAPVVSVAEVPEAPIAAVPETISTVEEVAEKKPVRRTRAKAVKADKVEKAEKPEKAEKKPARPAKTVAAEATPVAEATPQAAEPAGPKRTGWWAAKTGA